MDQSSVCMYMFGFVKAFANPVITRIFNLLINTQNRLRLEKTRPGLQELCTRPSMQTVTGAGPSKHQSRSISASVGACVFRSVCSYPLYNKIFSNEQGQLSPIGFPGCFTITPQNSPILDSALQFTHCYLHALGLHIFISRQNQQHFKTLSLFAHCMYFSHLIHSPIRGC